MGDMCLKGAKHDYIKLCCAGYRQLCTMTYVRGELSYLAPLGSEKISAPYFKQCFFPGGGYYRPD